MSVKFNSTFKANLRIDNEGVVRGIKHQEYWTAEAGLKGREVATAYVRKIASILDISDSTLNQLEQHINYFDPHELKEKLQDKLQFSNEQTIMDGSTYTFCQTYLNIPVWEAGVTVTLKHNPLRVIAATNTCVSGINAKLPSSKAIQRYLQLFAAAENPDDELLKGAFQKATKSDMSSLFKMSGLDSNADLTRGRFFIYQYTKKQRAIEHVQLKDAPNSETWETPPTLPLPPVPETIKEDDWYMVAELFFQLPVDEESMYWRALVEIETDTVLYLRAMTSGLNGLVFEYDPITSTGNATNTPNKSNAVLNPCRTSVPLQNLDQPSSGLQHLSGSLVTVTNKETPNIAPPTQAAGTDFNYDARTNEFAAVNAYYHNDRFFRLVKDLGFNLTTYFGNIFPVKVDHRGSINVNDGVEINAHCKGNLNGIDHLCYALADLSNIKEPIGIAADWRVVLHELGGHGILYNYIGSPNFGFAHSAGDSFAMVLNDFASKWHDGMNIDRFALTPFVPAITRRSDRAVSDGWGWGGHHDQNGYYSEQILSTTMFRAYRSIGGDSTSFARRRFAAHTMAYLMLRAVSTLSQANRLNHASGFLDALLTVDLLNWYSSDGVYYGGAYGKVLTWAFEKQNLNGGKVPEVDVYIDDGRVGEYQYLPVHWNTTSVWSRHKPDGLSGHQEPIEGVTNYAYVRIKNRGSIIAQNTVVRGYHSKPSAGTVWPNDWKPMATPQIFVGTLQPNNAEEKIVGPFKWVPNQNCWGHDCMLMIVSADGDPSNVDNFIDDEFIEDWRLVPNDNNIAQRNVVLVAGAGGITGLVASLHGKGFWIKNPLKYEALVGVTVKIPSWLEKLGWQIVVRDFPVRGVMMKGYEERQVTFDVIAGKPFTINDVTGGVIIKRVDLDIVVTSTVNGAMLGGITYTVDPDMIFPLIICQKCGQPCIENHTCPEIICPKCGRTIEPGRPHRCIVVPTCPNCGIATTVKHSCICKNCGRLYTPNHICIIPVRCPICGGSLPCKCMIIPRVVAEADVAKFIEAGWEFKSQLKSGDVIVEKAIDVEAIAGKVLEQANKQLAEEIEQADIEKITEKVNEQAKKQIEDAIAKEKLRLQKE